MIILDKLKLAPLYLKLVIILRKIFWSIKYQKNFFGQFLSRKRKDILHPYLFLAIIISYNVRKI